MPSQQKIAIIDASVLPYPYRLCASALQGLLNRRGAHVMLDYGIYDDPSARRTNEVFLDDELWFGKYRDLLGYQDRYNIEYYTQAHGLEFEHVTLEKLIQSNCDQLKGYVVWDESLDDTINIALMIAAKENLLPVNRGMEPWAQELGLHCVEDLTGGWSDRVALYKWAFENLFTQCSAGKIACVEPGWQRPEFVDYIVQNKLFVSNLNSTHKGLGSTLFFCWPSVPPGCAK